VAGSGDVGDGRLGRRGQALRALQIFLKFLGESHPTTVEVRRFLTALETKNGEVQFRRRFEMQPFKLFRREGGFDWRSGYGLRKDYPIVNIAQSQSAGD